VVSYPKANQGSKIQPYPERAHILPGRLLNFDSYPTWVLAVQPKGERVKGIVPSVELSDNAITFPVGVPLTSLQSTSTIRSYKYRPTRILYIVVCLVTILIAHCLSFCIDTMAAASPAFIPEANDPKGRLPLLVACDPRRCRTRDIHSGVTLGTVRVPICSKCTAHRGKRTDSCTVHNMNIVSYLHSCFETQSLCTSTFNL
jgi:hypothetical protein